MLGDRAGFEGERAPRGAPGAEGRGRGVRERGARPGGGGRAAGTRLRCRWGPPEGTARGGHGEPGAGAPGAPGRARGPGAGVWGLGAAAPPGGGSGAIRCPPGWRHRGRSAARCCERRAGRPGSCWRSPGPVRVMNEERWLAVWVFLLFIIYFSTAESQGAFLSLQQPRCCVEMCCVLMACLRFAGAFCNLPGVISLQGILQLESASSCGVVTSRHCVHMTIQC